jgi:hypothetical protein
MPKIIFAAWALVAFSVGWNVLSSNPPIIFALCMEVTALAAQAPISPASENGSPKV